MSDEKRRLLILGAHPDDAEYHAGGLAIVYRSLGHDVKMVSVTNGGAGHHRYSSEELVKIRRQEAAAAGNVIGAEYVTWDNPDGGLLPSLDLRDQIIREIRTYQPDLVVTHRTNDYHPDHRAVGQAVQDASYMVTVPLVVTDVPFLEKDPVVAYMVDLFTKPCPFEPAAVLDTTEHVDTIIEMMSCHASQFYDFLPFNHGVADEVPEDDGEKKAWLRDWFGRRTGERAVRFRDQLVTAYGSDRGNGVQFMEAYEISEYAADIDHDLMQSVFPFLG